MDFSELQEKYVPILKEHSLPILLGVIGFGFLIYGLIGSVLPKSDKSEMSFEAASTADASSTEASKSGKQLVIDIEGAVIKPGVYKLPDDSRIQDALIAAGGLSDKADREKIAKGLNLAAKISDGGKIYIPFVGDTAAATGGSAGGSSQAVIGDSTGGAININSATATELDSLSGVGPATAEKIIGNRPYEKIEDLLSKKSVGNSVFEKIKDKISVY